MVRAGQPFLGQDLRDLLFIRIGVNFRLVETAFDVVTLSLLCVDHRDAIFVGAHSRQRDAAGLGGEDQVDLADVEDPGEFIGHPGHELAVDTVVQKPVDLHDVSGQNLALLLDALLEFLHNVPPI